MNYEELTTRLGEVDARLTEIAGQAEARDLKEDERGEWNTLNEERDSLKASIAEKDAIKERMSQIAENPENVHEALAPPQVARPGATRGNDIWDIRSLRSLSPDQELTELEDRGKRIIEDAVPAHPELSREDAQEALLRMQGTLDGEEGSFSRHLVITGGPVYRRAWVKAMSGVRGFMSVSPEERAALSLSAENGGYLLPYQLDPTIMPISDGVINPLRRISRNVQTTANVWKGVTTTGMTAAYREAEGEETTDDSPTFAQPEIVCHAADAFAQWTFEFNQDYGSISGELATLVAEAKDVLEATKFATGSGEKEPFGVYTGAEEVSETATEKAFALADLYTVEGALAPRWRSNAEWVANRAIYNLVNQFEGEGGPLWVTLNNLQAGLRNTAAGNTGRSLLEYPANELSTAQATVTQNKYILLFGDFRQYVIADRVGMLAKPVDNIPGEEGRPTGQEGLYFFWRNGAKVMTKKAFRKLKVK